MRSVRYRAGQEGLGAIVVNHTELWDVVIAGAGPAGSVLACALRSANPTATVCLLDRERFPRDKACGD